MKAIKLLVGYKEGSCLIFVICVSLCIVVFNTYSVVFLICFSSSCISYVASFSGITNLNEALTSWHIYILEGTLQLHTTKRTKENTDDYKTALTVDMDGIYIIYVSLQYCFHKIDPTSETVSMVLGCQIRCQSSSRTKMTYQWREVTGYHFVSI
jgi:hypothetical protein